MVDRKRYDIAASEDNPLDYATARRDSDVLSYLRTGLRRKPRFWPISRSWQAADHRVRCFTKD